MRLLLCKFLWNFDIELMPESQSWFPHNMVVIWNSPSLLVKLHFVAQQDQQSEKQTVSNERASN
jgi:hypothetical protein